PRLGQRRHRARLRHQSRQLHRFPFALHLAGARQGDPGALRHRLPADGEGRDGEGLPLLGRVLARRQGMDPGRRVRGLEEQRSESARVPLRQPRRRSRAIHDGPRSGAEAEDVGAAELLHLSARRGRRAAGGRTSDRAAVRRGQGERRSTRPGSAPVIFALDSTGVPLTITYEIPSEKWWGSSYVETSRIATGSKTTTSAFIPSRKIPRSLNPARDAASEVIFRTASSSGKTWTSRT